MMIYPKALQKWDRIWVVYPSNHVTEKLNWHMLQAKQILENWWFEVVLVDDYRKTDRYWYSAGEPKQRADDINNMFADKTISMIWMAHGWESANTVLEYLDFDLIKSNPKIITWISDISILLNVIQQKCWFVTFHWLGLKWWEWDKWFSADYTQDQFIKRFVQIQDWQIDANSDWQTIRWWKTEWELMWGTLECIIKMTGTKYQLDYQNKILMLEAYYMTPNVAQSYLTWMQQIWVFDQINWLIIWHMVSFDYDEYKYKDWTNIRFEDIVLDVTKNYNFPILKTKVFWHKHSGSFLPIWVQTLLDADNKVFNILSSWLE